MLGDVVSDGPQEPQDGPSGESGLFVRMPADMRLLLAIHAENADMSQAQVVRRAVKDYLQRQPDYVAPY